MLLWPWRRAHQSGDEAKQAFPIVWHHRARCCCQATYFLVYGCHDYLRSALLSISMCTLIIDILYVDGCRCAWCCRAAQSASLPLLDRPPWCHECHLVNDHGSSFHCRAWFGQDVGNEACKARFCHGVWRWKKEAGTCSGCGMGLTLIELYMRATQLGAKLGRAQISIVWRIENRERRKREEVKVEDNQEREIGSWVCGPHSHMS